MDTPDITVKWTTTNAPVTLAGIMHSVLMVLQSSICDENVNECLSDPCQNNGTCEDGIDSYKCRCKPGYSGGNCEMDISVCNMTNLVLFGESVMRCLNGGECVDGPGCTEGFRGKNCEEDIDECEVLPCNNGGLCVNLINDFQCFCPSDRLTHLRYADDVVLLSESPQELQLMVEELRTASNKVGLEINLSKTKVMFNRNVQTVFLHHSCSINFRTDRDVPQQYRSCPLRKQRKSGRPRNQDQEQAFLEMCFYLEANDEEQLTISDLGNKMKEFLTDKESTPYGNQYLKQKLMEHYGDSMYIADGEGVHDIVTMREKTSQILRSYFKSHGNKEDEEAQKRVIIKTAARLIRSDIKTDVPSTSDEYPSIEMLKLESAQFTVILMTVLAWTVTVHSSDDYAFDKAASYCIGEGKILVTIHSKSEEDELAEYLQSNDKTTVWIGLSKEEKQRWGWTFVDGVKIFHSLTLEYLDIQEDALAFLTPANHWASIENNSTINHHYICEIDLTLRRALNILYRRAQDRGTWRPTVVPS
ncbi:Protein eyes shut [Nymphon striatum]|nr:Protein eyes shut [Nymphon striatum]